MRTLPKTRSANKLAMGLYGQYTVYIYSILTIQAHCPGGYRFCCPICMKTPRPPDYAELHCLSAFSFQRGASLPEELVQRAHTLGYKALAVTDEC